MAAVATLAPLLLPHETTTKNYNIEVIVDGIGYSVSETTTKNYNTEEEEERETVGW